MTSAPLALPDRASSGMRVLALIVTLLALPFLVVGSLYLGGWRPAQTGEHGRLFSPPPLLPASGLQHSDGRQLPTAELQGKWLLILAGRGPCRVECAARIDEMRRLQVSLNKEMGRLRRIVLSDDAIAPSLRDFLRRQPDLVLATAPTDWLPDAVSGSEANAYRLYIADPQGRLIMSYPADVAGQAVRADLERLLKFAWTG
jgi:hypothetical protein